MKVSYSQIQGMDFQLSFLDLFDSCLKQSRLSTADDVDDRRRQWTRF